MRVYLVQHGKAKPAEEDPSRGLTGEGYAEVKQVADFLAGLRITALGCLAARGSSLEFEIAVSEYSRGDLSIPADLRADSGFQNLPEALNNSN